MRHEIFSFTLSKICRLPSYLFHLTIIVLQSFIIMSKLFYRTRKDVKFIVYQN